MASPVVRFGAALLLSCWSTGASSILLVNRFNGKCLDLHAPCEDGSHEANCSRVPFEDLKKGTNLQLFHCSQDQDPNQEFEVMSSGRIRNPLTGLCVDIQAPCRDHLRTPCERIPIHELQEKANIQLWDCNVDSGRLSNSIGNQVWAFREGNLVNLGSKLCLGPVGGEDMSNIHAATCNGEDSQRFDMKLAKPTVHYEDYEMPALQRLEGSSASNVTRVGLLSAAGAAMALMVCVLAGLRAHLHAPRDKDESRLLPSPELTVE